MLHGEGLTGRLRTVLADLEIIHEALRGTSLDVDDVCDRIREAGVRGVDAADVTHRIERLRDEGLLAERDGSLFVSREGADALVNGSTLLQCAACDLTPERVRGVMPGADAIRSREM